MKNKKQPVVKKEVPAKKSESKKVSKDTPKEQKYLIASVKIKNGVPRCNLVVSKVDSIAKSTGCKRIDAGEAIIVKGMEAVASGEKGLETAYNQYLAMMAEFKPQDVFEGMLLSQMTVTYVQAMDCLSMAANNKKYPKFFERFQNQGIKLMRLYNYQLETLAKHRRKGNQKMTVEHVHVHPGGQAVVGTVNQGGGVNHEK